MTRDEITTEYNVDANGIIRNPGKFEGEMLFAPFFYNDMLNGCGTETLADDSELFEITVEDRQQFPELENYAFALLAESDQGFVSVELTNDDPRDEELADEFDDEDEEEEEDQPDEEDGFITDRPFKGYDVSFAGKFLGNFKERDEAENTLKEAIRKGNFFPNCWFIDDHGGHLLISVTDEGMYWQQQADAANQQYQDSLKRDGITESEHIEQAMAWVDAQD